MSENTLIGIDIGGTKINFGKICQGEIVKEIRIPTDPLRPEKEILEDIVSGIEQVIDKNVRGIGIGVPGIVDSKLGLVHNITNIPSWKKVDLKGKIEQHFNIPVEIANDANCFVLGEKIYGKGKNYENIIGITLGTGLGAGIIINNRLYTGILSVAGEIADIPYLDSVFENYCSGKFFINKYKSTAEEMSISALKQNNEAIHAFEEYGGHLGNLIKTIILVYGPDMIIFGGSLSEAFDLFYPSINKQLEDFSHQNVLEKLKIVNFSHNKIPIIGAASLIPYTKKIKCESISHSYNEY